MWAGCGEYLNGSSTVKDFDPGAQAVQTGTDKETLSPRHDFSEAIPTATSKPF